MLISVPTRTLNLGAPINKQHPLNRGLVSRWDVLPFGPHYGGPRLLDLMGTNHGTLTNGPTWQGANGRPGGYGSVKGTTSDPSTYVATSAPSLPTYSFGLLVYLTTSVNAGMARMQLHYVHTRADVSPFGLQFYGGAFEDQPGLTTPTTGRWYDLLITCAGTAAGDVKIYLDGKDDTGTATAISAPSGTTVQLGGISEAFGSQAAYCDAFRLYSRVLSASEAYASFEDLRRGSPETLNWISTRSYPISAAGTTTRGMPFGHRSTAFAGGRTLIGNIR